MGEILKRVKDGRFLGYSLRFYEDGRRRVIASKQPSHGEARRMLLEIEARIARGEVGLAERPRAVSMRELIERFLTEYSRPRIKDLQRYRQFAGSNLRRAASLFAMPAGQITAADVSRLRESLRRDYAPASAAATLSFLGVVFSWAVREGLVSTNPCRGVERPQGLGSADYLSREEVKRLLAVAEAGAESSVMQRMLYLAVSLALYTGLRKGELLGLRWTDLDLQTRRLTVARSYGRAPKGSRPRHLRLPLALVPLFEAWRRDCPTADGVVFPVGKGYRAAREGAMLGLRRLWAEVGLRAALHPWHCLRHTMASHYVMSGGNILALQKILGHADLKITLIYAHLSPAFLDGELDRIKY